MIVISMWCEWDIGINDNLWADLSKAKEDVKEALIGCGIEDDLQELRDEGLVGFELKEVIFE